jgi:hypothetical protein
MRFPSSLIAALVISAAPALAECTRVHVAMHDGLVSVSARDAMLGEILDAWARVGQTKIINAEKIVGEPLTIQLVDVPEEQALDMLLRSVGGYLAAARSAAVVDASRFDRIMILPTRAGESSTVRQAAPTLVSPVLPPQQTLPPQSASPMSGIARIIGPERLPVEDDQPDAPAAPPPESPPALDRPPYAPPSTLGSPVPGMVVTPPQQDPRSTRRRR